MNKYKKYKWFFTASGKLVIGGKSAEQNDSLIKEMKESKEDFIVMHTSSPGSPFSFIVSKIKEVTKKDLEECAIFTACFSRAWKNKKKNEEIHIFKLSDLVKSQKMKTGTWAVLGKPKKIKVNLELCLTIQDNVLRAVPESSVKNKDKLLKIIPGDKDKKDLLPKIKAKLPTFTDEEILSALPAGGIKIK